MGFSRSAAALLAVLTSLVWAGSALASPSGVVISQVYGGGGNSGATLKNDFIELYNAGTTDAPLTGWSVQYASSAGSTWQVTPLSGSIPAGGYYLVHEAAGAGGSVDLPPADATGSIPMAAGSGKVALVNSTGALVGTCPAAHDFVGYGAANCFEGSGAAPTLTNTTAALRGGDGAIDTDNNASDFAAGAPNPRNSSFGFESAPTVTAVTPAAGSSDASNSTNLTVTFSEPVNVAPGTFSLTCASSGAHALAVSGGPTTFTLDPSPDLASGESCTATVSAAGVTDQDLNDPPNAMAADFTWSFSSLTIRTIGEIQGSVGPATDGLLHRSSFAPPSGNGNGQVVVVRGVIYEETRNGNNRGFFIQNTAAQADGDPFTSDGIFVFVGGFDTLLGGYNPTVGDEIVLRGNVAEFFNFTQLASPRLVELVSTLNNVDALLPAAETNPPDVLADANRYWERQESMRMRVPAGARITDGLDVFAGPDSEMWVMRGDHPLASRTDPYAQRAFRDPHPLDNHPQPLFDDGNGYRILVGAFGVKGAVNNPNINLSPARTFDTLTNDLVGGIYFNFGKYAVMTVNQPSLTHGVDPSLNNPPTAPNRSVEYSVGDYNVENLYDFRDDPFDGCDFAGNTGCPGVNPPFDFVPANNAVYQERLGLIGQQIVGDLHSPDIILVQEAEDQDICAVVGGALDCDDGVNNRDGKPDTLQELALRIAAGGGPAYDAAYDRDGSDDRGIVAALMYRTDRVELLPATADHPVLGNSPQVQYRVAGNAYNNDVQNPKSLNAPLPADVDRSSGVDGSEVYTRDPQVGWFRIWRDGIGTSVFTDVYAISNHFSSTPDARRGQRKEQAGYLAAIVDALGADRVVAGGDFNVFPRPDDPVPAGPITDQLGPLYDAGLWNLWDTMVAENPSAAYSYVFVGQAQTLDGQFVTPTLKDELGEARVAHVNADFPAEFPGDGARGLSDHDPMASTYDGAPTLARLADLVRYYRASGDIGSDRTVRILLDRLDRAGRLQAQGKIDAYAEQLQAFADQARDFAPDRIDPEAADALATEAEFLKGLST